MTKYVVTYKNGKHVVLDDNDPIQKHQLRIARQDMRMSEGMKGVMGAQDVTSVKRSKP